MASRRRWLAAGLPALVLLGVMTAASQRPAVDTCPGGPSAVLLPRAEQVPDLVGLDGAAARATAERAGMTWTAREERWTVDDAPAGTVLAQRGGACADPLRLGLSTGGPLVDPADQAPAAQEALGVDPGPVRVVRLSEGVALQTDTVVVGECPAVDALVAQGTVGDDAAVTCYPAPADALVDVVRSGSGFLGGDEPVRMLTASSGTSMAESAKGWTADRAGDGWRLTVLVGTTRGVTGLRCRPASEYEVCAVRERPDGTAVATAHVVGERPLGSLFVSLEAVVQGGSWRVRVVLTPDLEAATGPERATAPPADLDTLVRLADEARAAVAPVVAP